MSESSDRLRPAPAARFARPEHRLDFGVALTALRREQHAASTTLSAAPRSARTSVLSRVSLRRLLHPERALRCDRASSGWLAFQERLDTDPD